MIGRVWEIARSVALDALRRRLVYVVVFFAGVFSVAIPSLPSFGLGVVGALYREVALAVIYAAAVVVALSLTATRMPSELERRTVFAVLTRPVSRAEYVVGTWLGVMITMAWVVAAFTVIAQVAGAISYGEANWRLWQAALTIWFEAGVIGTVALAVSTRAGAVTSTLAALVLAFVGHSRGSLLTEADGALWTLYPSLDAFNVINPVAHGTGVSMGYLAATVLVFVGWTGVLLVLAVALFRGRDL